MFAPIGAAAGGAGLIGLHAWRFGNWLVDDAAITFAYARNVAEGSGSVLQPGAAPTEGYSNPAWLAVLAGGRLLGLFDRGTIFGIPDYVLFPKAAALLCCVGLLFGCHTAARKVTRRPFLVTIATGAVLALIPSFVIWIVSGLENPLFALVTFWLAVVLFTAALDDHLLSPHTAVLTGLLSALAALSRPDGLIYSASYPLLVLILLRRTRWRTSVRSVALSVAVFAVPYGAYLIWRRTEFGLWTALPAVAKHQRAPEVNQLARIGELVQYAGAPAALAVVLCLGMALVRPSRLRTGLVALLVPLTLSLVAYAVLMPDWMGEFRFATPVWTLTAFIAVLCLTEAFQQAAPRGRAVLSVALAGALLVSASNFVSFSNTLRTTPTVPMCDVVERMGRVFNAYQTIVRAEQGSLLLPDIGGTALTSDLRIVDLAGLAEPRLAQLWRSGDMAGVRNYVFDDVKPTFIHTHGYWSTATGIPADPRLGRDYYIIFWKPDSVNGDWVRKDAVTDPDRLASLREYADAVVVGIENENAASPRARCGPVLRPGQLPARTGAT